jgi:hypothetical protein
MSEEVSYFSRFLLKFLEIIAAGLASAISAYLLAHFAGFLQSSPPATSAPAPIVVQVGPTTTPRCHHGDGAACNRRSAPAGGAPPMILGLGNWVIRG